MENVSGKPPLTSDDVTGLYLLHEDVVGLPELKQGMKVKVVELDVHIYQGTWWLRGRIEKPAGWISLAEWDGEKTAWTGRLASLTTEDKKEPPKKVEQPVTNEPPKVEVPMTEKEKRISERVAAGGLADAKPCICLHFRPPNVAGMFVFGRYNDEGDCEWFPQVTLPKSITALDYCTQLVTFQAAYRGRDVIVGGFFDHDGICGRLFLGMYQGKGKCKWLEPPIPSSIAESDTCTQVVAMSCGTDAFVGLHFVGGKLFFGLYSGEDELINWNTQAALPPAVTIEDTCTHLVAFKLAKEIMLCAFFDNTEVFDTTALTGRVSLDATKPFRGMLFFGKYNGQGVCEWFPQIDLPSSINSNFTCTQLFAFNSGAGGKDATICAYFASKDLVGNRSGGKLYFGKCSTQGCEWFQEAELPSSLTQKDTCTQLIAFNAGEGGKDIVLCAFFEQKLFFGEYIGEGRCTWFDERKSPAPNSPCDGAAALQEIPIPGWQP